MLLKTKSFHLFRSIFVVLLIFSAGSLLAQDKLILMNGNEVEVMVEKVGRDFIYSRSTNPADDHVYKYPKSEVVRIEYQDGRVEYFEDKPPAEDITEEEFVDQSAVPSTPSPKPRNQMKKKKERLFYLGLGTGLNVPLGRYGSSDGFDHGYARTGGFFAFESSVLFSSWMGMSVSIGYAANGMRDNAIQRKWELPNVSPINSSVSSWNHTFLLLGPYFTIRAEKSLYVDFKIKWGFGITPEPAYNFEYYDNSGVLTKIDNNNDTLSSGTWLSVSPITVDLGFAIRYNLNRKWGVMLQYDWLLVPMYFASTQNIRKYDGNGQVTDVETRPMDLYEIASINNIGLGIYFMIVGPKR